MRQGRGGITLPTYMVPTVWVVVEEFVFNTAGKLDRRALPAPDFSALAADYVALRVRGVGGGYGVRAGAGCCS